MKFSQFQNTLLEMWAQCRSTNAIVIRVQTLVLHTASILKAHLLNIAFCEARGMPWSGGNAVSAFMSTNTVLFHHGLEDFLIHSQLSFFTGHSFTESPSEDATDRAASPA